MMDAQLGLVVVGIVAVCALVLMAISMFGMKEKTYEEAIAEQRKLPDEHLLLGRSAKDKARDKKQKKAGKKVKEKSDREKTEQTESSSYTSNSSKNNQEKDSGHVDFEEPEAEILSGRPPQDKVKKKVKKPILLNKEESVLVTNEPVVPGNRFEEILPKDDLLLKKREEVPQEVAPKVNKTKSEKPANNPAPGSKVAAATKTEKVQAPKQEKPVAADRPSSQQREHVANGTSQPAPATPPPVKERSRKKRSELATLHQMSGDHEGVNVSLLMPLVQKAVLSRSEIQILIDLLLNKQQGPAIVSSEWIEGRQDPVVKLKKQLSEKEKALSEEQEAHQALQNKLKELRAELNAERSRISHATRQLEEALTNKQNETQALNARLQHAHDAANAEKQSLTQQVQQLQQKLNEEHVRLRSSQEEQSAMSQELLSQRQQLEMHIGHLNEQEAALKAQVAQLEGIHANLNAELQALEGQMLHYKESAEHAQDLARQVEELNLVRSELEHRTNASQQHEAALQFEINGLRSKLEELQGKLSCEEGTLQKLRVENENLGAELAAGKELQAEVQHLHDENSRLASQSLLLSEIQKEAQQLREENESLAAQLTAVTERPAAEGRENGDLQYTEEKQGNLLQHEQQDSIMKQKDVVIAQLEEELEKVTSELNTYKTEVSRLRDELEEQRSRNNEISQRVRQEEQTETKRLLLRIFPEVRVEDSKVHHKWVEQFESEVRGLLSELKSRPPCQDSSEVLIELEKQNSHLQAMVTHYKTIIDDTEGMLNKLQTHVEQEEARWRQQLQLKEAELEAATQQPIQEMQSKLVELQEKLERLEQERNELESKYESARASCCELEQAKSELVSQLAQEADQRQDLSQEVNKLRSLSQEQQANGVSENHNGPATEPSISETSSDTPRSEKGPKSRKRKGGSGKK